MEIPSTERDAGTAPAADQLALYGYKACFYCRRVEAAMAQLGLSIEYRDILRDPHHRADLVETTGRTRVPVLRIESAGETRWLPESRDIVRYLQAHYGRDDTEVPVRRSVQRGDLSRYLPWALLIAGGLLGAPLRRPLWIAAALWMVARSAGLAWRAGQGSAAVFHWVMAALFIGLAGFVYLS